MTSASTLASTGLLDEEARDRCPLGLRSSFPTRIGRAGFVRGLAGSGAAEASCAALRIDLRARESALNSLGHDPVAGFDAGFDDSQLSVAHLRS